MDKDLLNRRLFKKHELLESKNMLVVKRPAGQSTERESKQRSNSSVRLPSLDRLQTLNTSVMPTDQGQTHIISQRLKSKTVLPTQHSVLDLSRVENKQAAAALQKWSLSSRVAPLRSKLPTTEAITYLLRTGVLTVPKLIALLNASNNEEVLYLRHVDIYDYEATTFDQKGTDYITISRNGVLMDDRLVSMEQWLRDEAHHHRLRKIQLWQNYLALKTFGHWKSKMKRRLNQRTSQELLKYSPMANEYSMGEMLRIRGECIKLADHCQILQVRTQLSEDFLTYRTAQEEWMGKLIQKVARKQQKIEQSLLGMCFQSLKGYPLIFETKDELNKSVPVIENVAMRFDVKSAMKSSIEKLYRVVRTTDLQVMEAIGKLLINNLCELTASLTHKIESYDAATADLLKVSPTLPKDDYARRRDDILSLTQFNNWFGFNLSISVQDTLKLTPSLLEVNSFFNRHLKKVVQALAEFKRPLIMSTRFEFIRKNIKHIMQQLQDKNEPPIFTLIDYLHHNKKYEDALDNFNATLLRFVECYEERLATFDPFLRLYKQYSHNKSMPELTFHDVEATIEELSSNMDFVDRLQDGEYVIYGFVSNTEFKDEIFQRLKNYRARLMHYIPQRFHEEVNRLKQVLESHRTRLDTLVSDTSKFVLVMRQAGIVEERFSSYQVQLDDLRKIVGIYERETHTQLSGCNELVVLLGSVKSKLANYLSSKDSNMNRYRREVTDMYKTLEKEIVTTEGQLSDARYFEDKQNPGEVYHELQTVGNRMQKMLARLDEIVDFMVALSVSGERLHKLDLLWSEFASLQNVWRVLSGCEDLLLLTSKAQVMAVDLQAIQIEVGEYVETIEQEAKKNDKVSLIASARAHLQQIHDEVLMMECLQSKHLRTKDWEEFYGLLQKRFGLNLGQSNPYNPTLTIGLLRERKATELNSEVSELVVRAKKQTEIGEALDKFQQKWWPNIRLETIPYDGTLLIFTENQAVRRDIEENMMMLLGVINSKYGGFVRHRCQGLLRNLNALIKLLEELLVHQNNFIELYPTMSSTFCEKQLPLEYKEFQKIVSTTMRQMKVLINPVKGLAAEATMSLLTGNNKQFESIHKKLGAFLEKKRLQFQRFYFMEDLQMMEMLAGLAKDSSLHRMFEGITGWYEQEGVVVGVCGHGGEKLRLISWMFKQQQLQTTFRQLEEAVRYTLKTLIRQALNSYEVELKGLREVESRLPWMCTYTLEWILYCKQMEINYFSGQHDVTLQLQLLATNLHELLQNPGPNSNLITLTLHMLHLTRELQAHQITSVLDYEWQTVIRYYFEDDVVMRSLGGQFEWGGEYQGVWQVMVNTKDIRRAYATVLGGLNWGLGVVMQGPSGTGKTETLKELARSMARFCLVFNCSSLVSTRLLQKLLAGLCYTGSWICLDELNRLQIEVMSVVASQISLIRGAVLAKKDSFNFFGKEITLHLGIGIFATMNPNYTNRTELTENLKSYFRCVSVNLPEYEKILEVMLYSKGFREAAALAGSICKLYQLLGVQFNKQRHYDFGLRSMKTLMFLIDKIKTSKMPEEVAVRAALIENLKPRLTETDLVIFERTLTDLFPTDQKQMKQSNIVEDKYRSIVEASQLGTIVLGEASCKTTLIERYLQNSYSKVRRFNPNGCEPIYFFGGKLQSGWQAGVVEEILKDSINHPESKYVLYLDAQVRSEWVENFNTLLDDSKVLSLPSGSRLRLSHGNFRMIIETTDLLMTSPATITRCSIVYLSSDIITVQMTIARELAKLKFPPDLVRPLEEMLNQLPKEKIRSVMYMLSSLLPEYLLSKEEGWMYSEILGVQKLVVYLIAILGSYDKIKKLLIKELTPLKLPLSKYYVSFEKYPEGQYVPFDPLQDIPQEIQGQTMFVPNLGTCLCSHIIEKAVYGKKNLILKGSVGTGKSVAIKWALERLPQHSRVTLHVTKFLLSSKVSEFLEIKYQIQRKGEHDQDLIPLEGDRTVVYVDNIALASDTTSEYLRTFVQRRTHMESKTLEQRTVRDTAVIVETNRHVDQHILAQSFSLDYSINADTLQSIYLFLFKRLLLTSDLSQLMKNELDAMFADKFLRALIGFTLDSANSNDGHEYSMRQLSQLTESLRLLGPQCSKSIEQAVSMVLYQTSRVYYDRLQSQQHLEKTRLRFHKHFSDNFNKRFATELDTASRKFNPPVFSSLLTHENRQISDNFAQEIPKLEELVRKSQMKLLVPKFLVNHLCRVLRVHDLPSVNCIWVGQVGTGKSTILNIASKATSTELIHLPKRSSDQEPDNPHAQPTSTTDQEIAKFVFSCVRICATTKKQYYLHIPFQPHSLEVLQQFESLIAGDFALLNEEDKNYAVDHAADIDVGRKPKNTEEGVNDYIKFGLGYLKIFITVEKDKFEQLKAYPSLFSTCYVNNIGQWPNEALEEFSDKLLQGCSEKGMATLKEHLVMLSVGAFVKLKELNEGYRVEESSQEISPMLHIRFIKTYLKVLSEEQQNLKAQQDKFDRSIMKLGQTQALLAKMKQRLIEMEPQIKQKKDVMQKLIPGLELRRRQANEAKKIVEKDQAEVEAKRSKIEYMKAEAEDSLKEAQPLLTEAANAVSTIKRSQLSQIKSNNNPNRLVLFTLENVSMLLGDNGSWESIKKILTDTQLLSRLKGCTPKYDDYLKVKKRISEHPEWTLDNIEKVSYSCKSLARWVINVGKYSEINSVVGKQKIVLNDLRKDLIESQYVLKATQQRFQAANDNLSQVEGEFRATKQLIENFEREMQLNQERLARASSIQTGLGDSVERWKETVSKLESRLGQSFTECMFTSAMLELSSSYPGEVRQQLLAFMKERATNVSLPFREDYSVLDLFNPLDRQTWEKNGLSSDITSMQNGVFLMYHMNKFPIVVDPDNQAISWLQKSYELVFSRDKGAAEKAIKHGYKLIVPLEKNLDELAHSIISAKIEVKGSRKLIEFGGTSLELDPNFRMILCSKERNPTFGSGLMVRHPVVNFSITRKAIEAQLIIELLKQENEQVYRQKVDLELTRLNNQAKLSGLQLQLVDYLAENKGGLLEDDTLVNMLQNSSKTALEITVSADALEQKNSSMKFLLMNYQRLCEMAALIYIQLGMLGRVNPMLHWNYSYFIRIFLAACVETVSQEINNIEDALDFNEPGEAMYESFVFSHSNSTGSRPTSSLSRMSSRLSSRTYPNKAEDDAASPKNYRSVPQDTTNELSNQIYKRPQRVFDEKKKGHMDEERLHLVVSALLAKIKVGLQESDRKLLGLLLSLDKVSKSDARILFLSATKRENFRAYVDVGHLTKELLAFHESAKGSNEFYMTIANDPQPFNVNPRLKPFSCLVIVRMLRPDRFGEVLDKFIAHSGFGELLSSGDSNIFDVFKQIDEATPALFIMGDDPLNKLTEFLSRRRMMKHTLVISMGEGQTPIAEKALEKEYKRETILILHNLHISPSIFPNIARRLESGQANEKFRLIMIMKPSKQFPSAVSGRSLKITFEAPSGLKNKMMQLLRNNYNMIANEDQPSRSVAYAITLLHAIISDRSKFGPVGWNVPYQYTEMEYQCSLRILKEVVSRASNPHCVRCNVDDLDEVAHPLDFAALRNMIGEVNYEGRITDEQDRFKLKVLTQSFITPEVLNPDIRFMGVKSFTLPNTPTFEDMMEHIEKIVEQPTIYGLNPNQQPSASIPNEITKQVHKLFFEQTSHSKDKQATVTQVQLKLTGHSLSLVDEEIQLMNKLAAKPTFQFNLLSGVNSTTKVFDLRTFREPRKFFSDIRKEHAIKNGVEFEAVSLSYSFAPRDDCFGICNLLIEAGKITANMLDEGLQGTCPTIFIVPTSKRRQKHDKQQTADKQQHHGASKIRIPLYRTALRQGEINSFGENVNLVTMVELPSRRNQDFWTLRGTALLLPPDADSF